MYFTIFTHKHIDAQKQQAPSAISVQYSPIYCDDNHMQCTIDRHQTQRIPKRKHSHGKRKKYGDNRNSFGILISQFGIHNFAHNQDYCI